MKSIFFGLMTSILLGSCAGGGAGSVDQTNPKAVVQAIFDAAKSGNYGNLEQLCPPNDKGDKDVKSICGIASNQERQEEFKKYFAKGAVGETKEDGEKAAVKFTFGPDGSKEETMNLVKIDGKWYLASF